MRDDRDLVLLLHRNLRTKHRKTFLVYLNLLVHFWTGNIYRSPIPSSPRSFRKQCLVWDTVEKFTVSVSVWRIQIKGNHPLGTKESHRDYSDSLRIRKSRRIKTRIISQVVYHPQVIYTQLVLSSFYSFCHVRASSLSLINMDPLSPSEGSCSTHHRDHYPSLSISTFFIYI